MGSRFKVEGLGFRGPPQEKTKIYTREEFQEVLTKVPGIFSLGFSWVEGSGLAASTRVHVDFIRIL